MKKILGISAIIALICSLAYAAQRAASIEVDTLKWMQNGATAFQSRINSDGQYEISENVNISTTVLVIDDAVGDITFRNRTSAQIQVLAPSGPNKFIVNATVSALCVSTGTGAGAWVIMSTSSLHAANGTREHCY